MYSLYYQGLIHNKFFSFLEMQKFLFVLVIRPVSDKNNENETFRKHSPGWKNFEEISFKET